MFDRLQMWPEDDGSAATEVQQATIRAEGPFPRAFERITMGDTRQDELRTMARRDQPLYRDTEDSMIGGVCSGIGHYFDVDTTLVRVVFMVLAFFGGSGLLAYVILWLVLEPAPPGFWPEEVLPDAPGPPDTQDGP